MGKFNPSKYATEYIKNHYKRKEIKLKPEEFDILEKQSICSVFIN